MSSFQIISSLRYDPALPDLVSQIGADSYPDPLKTPYYLLPYHQDRLQNAASHFDWKSVTHSLQQDSTQFKQHLDAFIPDKTKSWRLRIVIDYNGYFTVDAAPAAPMNLRSLLLPPPMMTATSSPWHVYVDVNPTTPSAFTTYKTTAREDYTAARLRVGISSPQDLAEVLIVNTTGDVMEGSITTPYFRRREHPGHTTFSEGSGPGWITPPLSSGGNAGTTRRYALHQGFCIEQTIAASELVDGEDCLLSNSVRGFIHGKILLNNPKIRHK